MYAFRKTETFIEKNIKSDPCSSCFKNLWKYWFLTNWIKVLFHSQSDNCVPKIRFKSNETSLNWMDVCLVPGRHLTVFNSQSLLQVGGRWSEYKQTLDMPFQVKNKYTSLCRSRKTRVCAGTSQLGSNFSFNSLLSSSS